MVDVRSITNTTTGKVYNVLLKRIVDGQLKAGDRLPAESDLSEELDVSRVTVRRALDILRQEHLIESRRGSGNYAIVEPVATFDTVPGDEPGSLIQMIEVRRVLETAATRQAALTLKTSERPLIEESLARQDAIMASDSPRWLSLRAEDFQFHHLIWTFSHNVMMLELLKAIRASVCPVYKQWAAMEDQGHVELQRRILADHRRIGEAVLAGDADAAGHAAFHHIGGLLDHLR